MWFDVYLDCSVDGSSENKMSDGEKVCCEFVGVRSLGL